MTFHKVELRVIEIGSGEGTLEVFEVKGGRNFWVDLFGLESPAYLKLTVSIGIIFLTAFLWDSFNARELFEGKDFGAWAFGLIDFE